MSDGETGSPSELRYHLELTPVQLKITHTALHALLDDFGHEESDVMGVIHEVLAKLPDEHSIRAIQLDRELERQLGARRMPRDRSGGPEAPPAA